MVQFSEEEHSKVMEPDRYRTGTYTSSNTSGIEYETTSTGITRKRNASSSFEEGSNETIYEELEKLRSLVDDVDGERQVTRGTIDGSLMSTVFGVVLVMIISISIYAFTNLYKAVVKRFSEH